MEGREGRRRQEEAGGGRRRQEEAGGGRSSEATLLISSLLLDSLRLSYILMSLFLASLPPLARRFALRPNRTPTIPSKDRKEEGKDNKSI